MELGDDGRVLVRYSGTEPLLRVMMEGPNEERLKQLTERIVCKVREMLCENGGHPSPSASVPSAPPSSLEGEGKADRREIRG